MLAQRVASAAVGIPVIVLLIWAGGPWYAGASSLIILIAAYEFQTPHHGGVAPLALLAAGLAAALPAGAFVGLDWVYLAVFGTFAADTAAYFVGRAVGRRKLAPSISPGKTVEGTLAGLAGGFAAVVLANYLLGIRLEVALIVPLAVLLPIAAVLGDLAESILKRGMRVKDAGHVIPGHGGFLDRLDSLLFTVPVVYYFVTWVVP